MLLVMIFVVDHRHRLAQLTSTATIACQQGTEDPQAFPWGAGQVIKVLLKGYRSLPVLLPTMQMTDCLLATGTFPPARLVAAQATRALLYAILLQRQAHTIQRNLILITSEWQERGYPSIALDKSLLPPRSGYPSEGQIKIATAPWISMRYNHFCRNGFQNSRLQTCFLSSAMWMQITMAR
jgi:hypothetical protein